MKVYIKQRLFTLGDKFTIYNEFEEPVISVVGKIFTIGNKLNIFDKSGNEIFYVEQTLFKLLPEYRIFQNGRQVAFLKKEFSLFSPKININSDYGDFRINGDFFAYNFEISQNSDLVGTVSKKLLAFGDSYVLDLIKTDNIEFLVTMVIVIDQMLHDNKNSSNSN